MLKAPGRVLPSSKGLSSNLSSDAAKSLDLAASAKVHVSLLLACDLICEPQLLSQAEVDEVMRAFERLDLEERKASV